MFHWTLDWTFNPARSVSTDTWSKWQKILSELQLMSEFRFSNAQEKQLEFISNSFIHWYFIVISQDKCVELSYI